MDEKQTDLNLLKNTYNNAVKKLNALIKEDAEFKALFTELHNYCNQKYIGLFEKEDDQIQAFNIINDLVINQVTNGYWLFSEELKADKQYAEQFASIRKGVLRNVLSAQLEALYKENWYMFEGNKQTNLKVLNEYPNTFDTYQYVLELAATFGAYLAVISEETFQHKTNDNEDQLSLYLGSPLDAVFLTPEVYLTYQYHNESFETWNLFLIESIRFKERWLGTASFIKREKESYLNVHIENILSSIEKAQICKALVKKLPPEVAKMTLLQMAHLSQSPELYNADKFLAY